MRILSGPFAPGLPNNIPRKYEHKQLHPTFATGMKINQHITSKRLFLNIKQRDRYSRGLPIPGAL